MYLSCSYDEAMLAMGEAAEAVDPEARS
jgi:hypothetical protein